jgi:hypothetical protein
VGRLRPPGTPPPGGAPHPRILPLPAELRPENPPVAEGDRIRDCCEYVPVVVDEESGKILVYG